jgi:outer membrane protein
LSFTLALPLLKNAGRETVGAQLDSANAQLAASEYDLLQSNAQTVLNTTFAYWDYLAKQQNLEIATTAEQSSMALVDQLNRLIKGDQLPAADIELAIASRAEKTASRIAAEQALLDARRVLARQIGLPAMQMLNLPLPGDAYPRYDEAVRKLQLDRDALVKSALDQRADLAANRQRELAAKYLLVAARNNLKPQLDLNFSAGYAGLAENVPTTAFERAYYENRYGPSFSASISFRWPVENSLARGTVLSQSAQMDAATIQIRDLEATIASNVSTQVPGLERSVSQLAQGIEAVRRYTTAVNNEITKRRVGTSTVLDVINVEDRLVFARQNEVLLRQAYANAIAQLRFETGSLVHKKGDVYDVRASDLLEPVFGTAH